MLVRAARGAGLLVLALAAGCQSLVPPTTLDVPYTQEQVWAVAPFANESGVSIVDPFRFADSFMIEATQVDGITMLPVNRVIYAMRTLEMADIRTVNDAMSVMNLLDLDGLVVGSVTVYEPYRPLKLGIAVQLYTRAGGNTWDGQHVRDLADSPVGDTWGGATAGRPVAQSGNVFDSSNHQTLLDLAEYTAGRSEPDSAYGSDLYLVSMDVYARFVCYRLLADLLAQERAQLMPVADASP
ncbi:MAG: hypothetical protein HKO59_12190 [Phycisphaerales bacterium]|nr:hypothetical protein [Phycisphaerae bacterium]NNF42635.1 hypothetical protein [Phycisphaerales bacterium]NNM26722.1 hypothetical protein [Phycisphaerales bacterium]